MKAYKYVNYLWDEKYASSLGNDEVKLLIYRSNLLGADLRLTNYGGGNTSCKVEAIHPLTAEITDILWVKGSGGDLGSLKREGLAGLYLKGLLELEKIYRGVEYEDQMVALFDHCIYDLSSKAPSIDTPLHAFLPFRHIDHLHPDYAIAIAASQDGRKITEELFEGKIGWVDWKKPGFELGLRLRACLEQNPAIKGIMLGSHGLFTWGDTAYDSYLNSLDIIEQCGAYIHEALERRTVVFGGVATGTVSDDDCKKLVSTVAPLLRGMLHTEIPVIGHFENNDRVMEFVNSADLERLAAMGTSCPDHFLRTKVSPMVVDVRDALNGDNALLIEKLKQSISAYQEMYSAYYNAHKLPDSPRMRNSNPVIVLCPGLGLFSFAKDKPTARIAAEFYLNAINVMKGAEVISAYTSLPRSEAFAIEYWKLEEAKLQRLPKPKTLNGKVVLVTGSGGGIGKAIARKMAANGACIFICDKVEERVSKTIAEFRDEFGRDVISGCSADVTDETSIANLFDLIIKEFGGLDILVNNAGISVSKPFEEHDRKDWDLLNHLMLFGMQQVSKYAFHIMKQQGIGGDIINIVSKNAVVAGPNNIGYGAVKAAQAHMTRLMAAEFGPHKIRVNAVNPDAVIADSNIWAGGWAEGRAKAYGITVEELPAYYAKRTLLNATILPDDIANACYALVSGLFNKSTGNAINVDGGVASAFLR